MIMVVMGTRPEAIKLAPVIMELRRHRLPTVVVSTGQHRQMLDQVLRVFAIRPDHDLRIMKAGQSIGQVMTSVLTRLSSIVQKERPSLLIVQGDTTSALASSLVASFEKVPLAHVEAGLRTYRKDAPFPEEICRRLIDHVADLHFAPTENARDHLLHEGIPSASITVTGNTVVDALLHTKKTVRRFQEPQLRRLGPLQSKRLVVVTVHRREHWGAPLLQVCDAIGQVVDRFTDVVAVIPVHLNPQVRRVVQRRLGGQARIVLTPPLAYPDFVRLMDRSTLILTDSGGIQEEAPYLGKPVLVFRVATERPEAVAAGSSHVIGFETKRIVETCTSLLTSRTAYQRMATMARPFGDGQAGKRIVRAIQQWFTRRHVTS